MADKQEFSLEDHIKMSKKKGDFKKEKFNKKNKGPMKKFGGKNLNNKKQVQPVRAKRDLIQRKRQTTGKPGFNKWIKKTVTAPRTRQPINRGPPVRKFSSDQGLQKRVLKIYNLNPEINNKELYDLFVKYGAIESSGLDLDHKGSSLESATVKFRDPACSQRAIEELNRAELDGRIISVEYLKTPQKQQLQQQPRMNGNNRQDFRDGRGYSDVPMRRRRVFRKEREFRQRDNQRQNRPKRFNRGRGYRR